MFKKLFFGVLFIAYFLPDTAMAGNTKKCNAGTYLPANGTKCTKCVHANIPSEYKPDNSDTIAGIPWTWGIYCPGGTFSTGMPYPQGFVDCRSQSTDEKGYGAKSDMKKCEQKTAKCDSGYYMPAGSDTCTSCEYLDRTQGNWVCPGGWFFVKEAAATGIEKCNDKQIPNHRTGMDKCYDCPNNLVANIKTVNWKDKDDMPPYTLCVPDANLDKVTTKNEDQVWGYSSTDFADTSLTKVTLSNIPKVGPIVSPTLNWFGGISSSSSGQSTSGSTCPAGQVWVNGACVLCTSNPGWVNYAKENRLYCPGVTDTSKPILQQLNKCPKGMWPNATLTDCDCGFNLNKNTSNDGCVGNLSQDDMYYGPLGKSAPLFKQCWTKVSEKAYKKCMGFD